MTVFDYVTITVVALSVVLGLWRGVVGEVLALAAWIVAFVAARYAAPFVEPVLVTTLPEAALRLAVSWVLVFVGVLLVIAIARQLVKLMLRAAGLGLIDRLLGACFGVARGLLVVLFGVLVAGLTPLPKEIWWRDAVLAPPLETVVLVAKSWMPPELAKRIRFR